VGHPRGLVLRLACKEWTGSRYHRRSGRAVFAKAGFADLSTEVPGHHLESVTDAQHRDSQLQDAGAQAGGSLLIDTRGATAQNKGHRVLVPNFGGARFVGDDFGIHTGFANPTGNQLGILCTEVNDEYRAWLLTLVHASPRMSTRMALTVFVA
jgi:hypothetical protein